MRVASLGGPGEGAILAAQGGSAAAGRSEAERATGPQRSLEPGSFLVHAGALPEGRMAAVLNAVPTPTIVMFRDAAELLLNPAARAVLGLGEQERLRSVAELHSHVQLAKPDGESVDPSPLARALEGETLSAMLVRA